MASSLITIDDIVRKTSDLPSIPAAALRVVRETDSSTSTAGSVAHILAQDQALSVRVLRLANSAYYGLSRKVSDLSEAVIVLGMRSVRNLAMVASTYPWMIRPLAGYCLGPRQLWAHSFGVAVGAQAVAERSRVPGLEAAFTAGLLHDLGKVALSIWLENKVAALIALANRDGLTFDQAERKVLGFDHAEVGQYMAEAWNLPKSLVDGIRYHHEPNLCHPHSPIVDCVHVADYLTMTMGVGLGGDGLQYKFSPECLERIGLTFADLDAITETFVLVYEGYESMFAELQTI